jgi:fido (protein-threonine AMPylation protein)
MDKTDTSKTKKLFFQLKEMQTALTITQKDICATILFENAVNSSVMAYNFIDPAFIRTALYRGNSRVKKHISPIYQKVALEAIGLYKILKHLEQAAPKRNDLSVSLILKMHKYLFESSWPDIAGHFRNIDVRIRGLKHRPPHYPQISSLLYQHLGWVDGLMKLLGPISESNFFEVFHVAADIHCRVIESYPFQSGNWRLARALSNYVLQKSGMFAIIFDIDKQSDYMNAVNESSLTELTPLVNYLTEAYGETLERIYGFIVLIQKETE